MDGLATNTFQEGYSIHDEASQEEGDKKSYKYITDPEMNRKSSKKKRAGNFPTFIMDAASNVHKPKNANDVPVIYRNQETSSTHKDDITSSPKLFKKQKQDDMGSWDYDIRRRYRNAREKERSCQITQQILQLRTLLSLGGFTSDSRDSKSTILDKTANYIKILQKGQYVSQMERQQLMMSQSNILKKGVYDHDIGFNFQSPNSNHLLNYTSQSGKGGLHPSSHKQQVDSYGETTSRRDLMHIEEGDYRFVFEACSAGIAISSLGGTIIDCNEAFCKVCRCTKQELLGMTIFRLLDKTGLQMAYDQLCNMICEACQTKKPITSHNYPAKRNASCILLQGGIQVQHSTFSIALVQGNDGGCEKFLCLSLIPNHLLR